MEEDEGEPKPKEAGLGPTLKAKRRSYKTHASSSSLKNAVRLPTALMTITKRYWESAQVFAVPITSEQRKSGRENLPCGTSGLWAKAADVWMYITALSGKSIRPCAAVNHLHPTPHLHRGQVC